MISLGYSIATGQQHQNSGIAAQVSDKTVPKIPLRRTQADLHVGVLNTSPGFHAIWSLPLGHNGYRTPCHTK